MTRKHQTLVELDDRRRVALGRLADHDRYLATRDEQGRIILEPVVVMTETERRLLDNEQFWARVVASLEEPTTPFEPPSARA